MVLEPGTQAPEFEAEAAVSGKAIRPAMGCRLVLVFHGNKTQEAPKEVGKAVRAEHADPKDVLVANIVNLKPFNGMFKKVAQAQIKQTYARMSEKIGDGAEDYVILIEDFDNAIAPQFDVADSDKEAAIVVLDGDGKVIASAAGDALGEAALAGLA